MATEFLGEDDDDKRRRNLMTFAAAICLSAFFGIELRELGAKFVPALMSVPKWKTWLAGMLVNAYLVFRYVVRDAGRGSDGTLLWTDLLDLRAALRAVKKSKFEWWLATKTQRQQEVGLHKILRFRLLKGDPASVLLAKARAEVEKEARLKEHRLTMSWTTPQLPPSQPVPYGKVTLILQVDEVPAGRTVTIQEDAEFDTSSWRARWVYLISLAQLLFASRMAIDVLLPYYLASAAAVVMTVRLLVG